MLSLFGMLAFVLFLEKLNCVMDRNVLQSCMALAFVNIKTPVYTDVCELSVKRITLLDQFADVQCSLISSSISHDASSFDEPSDLKDLFEPPDNRKLIKPNQSAVANTNMIRGLAEIMTA